MISLKQYLEQNKLTLQYHDKLNPKLWNGEKLDPKVREKLIEIAKFWMEYALIEKSALKDILITGGNVNYNYTKYSDIDLHILIDKSKVADCDKEILDEFFKDKKSLWGLSHDVKIYGIPVEIYAQDIKEKASSDQGLFSIKQNKWIRKPTYEKINIKDSLIIKKVRNIENHINYFINNKVNNIKILESFKEKIRTMRSSAIEKGGEFSVENLVFKELRNKGVLDKFAEYILSVEDKNLSLKK